MNYANIMTQFEDTGLLRPVTESAIFLPDGTEIPNKKALVFEDDGSYISTVGKKYKIIQNEEVFSHVAEALVDSNLDLEGLSVATSGSSNSGRHLAKLTLPSHLFETSKGDKTAMQILVRNSHDSTWKFSVDVGGFRMACANGQVWGDYLSAYSNLHTQNYAIERLTGHLDGMIDQFDTMGSQWIKMQGIKIDDNQAKAIILDYLNKKWATIEKKESYFESAKTTAPIELWMLWNNYKKEMGSTLWAMYNVLTDYGSHIGESINPAVLEVRRQENIFPTINNYLMAA
jgi:hypothetical protein